MQLGHALGLSVTAEGVETTGQLVGAARARLRPRPGLLLRAPAARRDRAGARAPPLPLAPARRRRLPTCADAGCSAVASVGVVGRAPGAEHAPRVDAGVVAVVPVDLHAPRADELGRLGRERLRARRASATRRGPARAGPGTRRTGS